MMNDEELRRRRTEFAVFLFLAVFLAPLLAFAGVGGYGLLIWLLQ